ncbi:MAG: hypothetical protein JNL57_02900 [Bacteroidetes bacterium]|nr:hypothetical protein [Bacteroidota bacterium]
MKTKIISLTVMYSLLHFLQAQPIHMAMKAETFKIPGKEGYNASGLTWNPKMKMYYTAFAGNSKYPLYAIRENGEAASGAIPLGFDSRGLWYNTKEKCLQGNAYYDKGLYKMTIAATGFPVSGEQVYSGQHQPSENSIGAFAEKKKEIWYYKSGFLYKYKIKDGAFSGSKKLETGTYEISLNNNAMVYTGLKNREIGLYDYKNNRVLLFSAKSGKLTELWAIPDSTLDYPDSYNISYCNGRFWIFHKSGREWRGFTLKK